MKLRAPAYPLITIDPYMSVWSMGDRLNAGTVRHWTGRDMPLDGLADIDGETYVFMGDAGRLGLPGMEQTSVEVEAFATRYRFEAGGVELTAEFLSPVLPDDLQLLSRPVSYLRTAVRTTDGGAHRVAVTVRASEAFCRGADPAALLERLGFQRKEEELSVSIRAFFSRPCRGGC